jgi:tRNA uridine 5-carbamoylmethylation protein Kti12
MSEGKLLLLIKGQPQTGKTTMAAMLAKRLKFSFTKLINCEKTYNLNESQKKEHLIRIF